MFLDLLEESPMNVTILKLLRVSYSFFNIIIIIYLKILTDTNYITL